MAMLIMDAESDPESEIWNTSLQQDGEDSDLEKKTFECDICKKRLLLKNILKKHIIMDHLTKNFNRSEWHCDGCQRIFSTESSFQCHKAAFPGFHKFLCDKCGTIFLTNEAHEKHIATQHPHVSDAATQKPACKICSDNFVDFEYLRIHLEERHNEKRKNYPLYCCSFCKKAFSKEKTARSHEKKHLKDFFDCDICSKKYTSKLRLKSHMKTHNKTKKLPAVHYKCLICPRTFTSNDGIKYHLATHTGEKRYGCNQCNRRFIKKTHLTEHAATHASVKYFVCENCPRRFSTHSAYKKHIKMFPGAHNYHCNKCGKTFMKESMLEKHLCVDLVAVTLAPEVVAQLSEDVVEEYICLAEEADKEAAIQGMFPCCTCFQLFATEESLHQHKSEHFGQKFYQCRFCPETFNRSDSFSTHIVNHLGSTPYMCRQCNRKFISQTTLAMHLKKYPGEHSFSCQRCNRWFPNNDRLEKHDCILENQDTFLCACQKEFRDYRQFILHFGKKPLKCCSCDLEFLSPVTLTKHIKRHTGSRQFVCEICSKTFGTKTIYRGHLKTHENGAWLSCAHCNYRTIYRRRLNYHTAKRHEISASSVCPVCGVLFPKLSKLTKHLQTVHNNAVMLASDEPQKKSSLPTELCTLCGKMLINKYSLRSHMRKQHGDINTTENQYSEGQSLTCNVCNITCETVKLLRKHMRQHDSKPFACPICSKRFKVANSLKYHSTICGQERKKKEKIVQQ